MSILKGKTYRANKWTGYSKIEASAMKELISPFRLDIKYDLKQD